MDLVQDKQFFPTMTAYHVVEHSRGMLFLQIYLELYLRPGKAHLNE